MEIFSTRSRAITQLALAGALTLGTLGLPKPVRAEQDRQPSYTPAERTLSITSDCDEGYVRAYLDLDLKDSLRLGPKEGILIQIVEVPSSQTNSWEIFGNAGDSELGLESLKVMLTGPDINAPTTSNPRTRFTPGGLYGFGFSRLSRASDGGAAIEELASQTATLAQCSVIKPKVEVTVYVDTEGSFDASFEEINPDRKPTEDDSSD